MINTQYETREAWLEALVDKLRPSFAELGKPLPDRIRISVGFPRGSRGKSAAIGQCWSGAAADDGVNQIFISPTLTDPARVCGVATHECSHSAAGIEQGHKKAFKLIAEGMGLTGKMTATTETPEFEAWARRVVRDLGPYPHAGLNESAGRKKQTTRLIKAECNDCWAIIRLTRRVIESPGLPPCACGGKFAEAEAGA